MPPIEIYLLRLVPMIRLFVRFFGLVCLAAGVAILVIDGTRSIAASEIETLPLSALLGERVAGLQHTLEALHPIIWNPLAMLVLNWPSCLVLTATGALVLWSARRKSRDAEFAYRA